MIQRLIATGFLVAVLAGLVAATASAQGAAPRVGVGAATSSAGTLTIGLQAPSLAIQIGLGLRHGYFKRAGITEIKFIVFSTLPAMFAALAQGQVDLISQTIPAVAAYNAATSGTKLKFVAAAAKDTLRWIVRNDSTLPVATKADWQSSVRAWKGKKIGVPVRGGILDLYLIYMLKQVGMDINTDVTIQAIGGGQAPLVSALDKGLVDLIGADYFTLALIQAERIGRSVMSLGAGQGPSQLLGLPINGWIASDTAIQKDRARYAAFANAIQRTRLFTRDPKNKADVIDVMVRKFGVTKEQAPFVYDGFVASSAYAVLNKQIVGKALQTFITTGVLTGQAPSYSSLVADFAR